jgi:hypothetical protein
MDSVHLHFFTTQGGFLIFPLQGRQWNTRHRLCIHHGRGNRFPGHHVRHPFAAMTTAGIADFDPQVGPPYSGHQATITPFTAASDFVGHTMAMQLSSTIEQWLHAGVHRRSSTTTAHPCLYSCPWWRCPLSRHQQRQPQRPRRMLLLHQGRRPRRPLLHPQRRPPRPLLHP